MTVLPTRLARAGVIVAVGLMTWLPVRAEFRAGAAVVNANPRTLPVLVNGGILSRTVDKIKTQINARAVVMADGKEQLALVVVDSCMMERPFLDEVKALAAARTGIRADRMLISATHAHTAPSSMGALGTDADQTYIGVLREKIVEAIVAAQSALEPAQIGFGKANAQGYTATRRWIYRPDRMAVDPFGNRSVRATMHAGRNLDDVTGEAGPIDPDLSLISIQSAAGRPIAVLGNFSMHYFGDQHISADYFGLFAEGLKDRLAAGTTGAKAPFVGMMSHGCSGDIWRRDYRNPNWDVNYTIEAYANGLLDIAMTIYRSISYKKDVDLAMVEQRMTIPYRVPDLQRLEWAKKIVAGMGDRLAKDRTEVYAREQILLHERQQTEVVVQALRIGDIAIATSPCETYAVTGLKIKAASPLKNTIVIELANGGDGYIPPPEQHQFGGYNTWAARSAGLAVNAEPKIAEAAISSLEKVTGKPRRAWELEPGEGTKAVLKLKPLAYWRLNEFSGPIAADASGNHNVAAFESAITYYLEGPKAVAFAGQSEINRAPHFVGDRLHAKLPGVKDRYTVSLWVWNGLPNDVRDVSGWLFSRGPIYGLSAHGDHLGVSGKGPEANRLRFLRGQGTTPAIHGQNGIPRWEWRHVAFVRDGSKVRVWLDGRLELETDSPTVATPELDNWFFGGRSDGDSSWEGRLDEIAVFDRALKPKEIEQLSGGVRARQTAAR